MPHGRYEHGFNVNLYLEDPMDVNFKHLFFVIILSSCTGKLSSGEFKDKVCQGGGDASYCDVSSAPDVGTVAETTDAGPGTDVEESDVPVTDTETVEAHSELPQPDVEGELPEPDVPETQTTDTDGGNEDVDASIEEIDDVADTTPEISDDAETDLPDIATVEVGEDASDADGNMDAVPEIGEDSEVDASPDTPDIIAGPDTKPPKCLSKEGCEDGNPCTDNTCEPATGCITLSNQATCTDSSVCTEGDLCQGSACSSGKVLVCDDGNVCTSDACDPKVGCVFTFVTASCNDGNSCTDQDTCVAGICAGAPKNCNDGNACTEDSCSGGTCSSKAVPFGTLCGDSSLCNKQGVCAAVTVPSDMVLVPAGEYWRGCNTAVDTECQPDEAPYLKVFISAFLIGKAEVTLKEYSACQAAGKCKLGGEKPGCAFAGDQGDMPMNCINWNDAKAYCEWKSGRLPTEAEWQKAARGGCDKYSGKDCKAVMPKFPWGNDTPTCKHAYHYACGGNSPYLDFLKEGMSPYGAYHMAGNVAEWVEDVNIPYTPDQTVDPKGATTGFEWRMFLGGSIKSPPAHLRVSARTKGENIVSNPTVGVRCAKSIVY